MIEDALLARCTRLAAPQRMSPAVNVCSHAIGHCLESPKQACIFSMHFVFASHDKNSASRACRCKSGKSALSAGKGVYVATEMQSVLYECGPHFGCPMGLDCPYAVTQRVSKADAWTAAHCTGHFCHPYSLLGLTPPLLL